MLKVLVYLTLVLLGLTCVLGVSERVILSAVRALDEHGPAPYFAVNEESNINYTSVESTYTILNRKQVDEIVANQRNVVIRKMDELDSDDDGANYIQFIHQSLQFFRLQFESQIHNNINMNPLKANNDLGTALSRLSRAFVKLTIICSNVSLNGSINDFYLMGTGLGISDTDVMSASHNFDCTLIHPSLVLTRVEANRAKLSILNDGIPEIDDISFLMFENIKTLNVELNVNPLIAPINDSLNYHKYSMGMPIVCIGFASNAPHMMSRDGYIINRSELDIIYGKPGDLVASFGVIGDINKYFNQTCNHLTHETTEYYNLTKHNIAHVSSIIGGMSGGICIDAFDPSSILSVNSHGRQRDPVIVEIHQNGETIHRASIMNFATLVYYSQAYYDYSPFNYYYYYPIKRVAASLYSHACMYFYDSFQSMNGYCYARLTQASEIYWSFSDSLVSTLTSAYEKYILMNLGKKEDL